MKDFTAAEIIVILDTAASFKEVAERDVKKMLLLHGKTVVNLFFEPSTRTQISFEIAGKRLSADVINVPVSNSSMKKGESLRDMVENLAAMGTDAFVVRHKSAGVPHMLARYLSIPVINAGDGAHEHPTQSLLDLYTIRESFGTLAGRRVLIVGDIARSRVARSNIIAMRKLDMHVSVCAPLTMLPAGIESWGVNYYTSNFDVAIQNTDVVMMLRIQRERHSGMLFLSLQRYIRRYCLTSARMRLAKPGTVVMHPGPINRGIEMTSEVADGLESLILQQVANGVAVRMAVLYLIVGDNKNIDHEFIS